MHQNRRRARLITTLAAVVGFAGCNGPGSPSIGSELPSIESFGLTRSGKFKENLSSAVSVVNLLLQLENLYKYKISMPDTLTRDQIGIYLVSGDSLGDREFAFVIPESRAIAINADKIPNLVRSYGGNASENNHISGILAIVLLHELGHIRQLETGENVGLEPVAWADISAQAGRSRNRELNADYFASHLLRISWELVQAAESNPLQFIRDNRASGAELRRLVDLHEVLRIALSQVKKRGQFGTATSYSHLDNDLRLLIYWTVAHTDGDMADLVRLEIARRNNEDKFLRLNPTPSSTQETGILPTKFQKYIAGLKSADQQTRDGAARALRAEEPLPLELLPILIDSLNQKYGETQGITYVLQSYGRKAVPDLIRALKSTNPLVRESAVLCLAQMGTTEAKAARPALQRALSDENRYVRIRARAALSLPPTERLSDADQPK